MNEKTDKKIYWVEGVSKSEVLKNLNDTRPSIFRNQLIRRILVASIAVFIVGFGVVVFIEQPKLRSYSEIFLFAVFLLLYFLLRKSVRLIADAPSELLDERQILIRNNAYLYAYRWMTYISLVYIVFWFFIYREIVYLPFQSNEIFLSRAIFTFCCWMACMPSMVLAWGMPSEEKS
jgi:hypothetical protein